MAARRTIANLKLEAKTAHICEPNYSSRPVAAFPALTSKIGCWLENSTHCSTPAIQKKQDPQNVDIALPHRVSSAQHPGSFVSGIARAPHSRNPQPPIVLHTAIQYPMELSLGFHHEPAASAMATCPTKTKPMEGKTWRRSMKKTWVPMEAVPFSSTGYQIAAGMKKMMVEMKKTYAAITAGWDQSGFHDHQSYPVRFAFLTVSSETGGALRASSSAPSPAPFAPSSVRFVMVARNSWLPMRISISRAGSPGFSPSSLEYPIP
mmetsp:Transcript_1805/g.4872  ORF Transcript_1805/g.4872 Transcript_1805/m.4872 type:complete len:263 (-) Transcript_1805:475-1263(-)